MKSNSEIVHHLMDLVTARVEELGLTQAAASEMAGVAGPRFSEIKYHRAQIAIDGLVSILRRLGVEVSFAVSVDETRKVR